MIKYFCDKCGKELFWYGNITPSNTYANINTMAQNFNADSFKTYDSSSDRWLDLCIDCRNSLYKEFYSIANSNIEQRR